MGQVQIINSSSRLFEFNWFSWSDLIDHLPLLLADLLTFPTYRCRLADQASAAIGSR